MSKSLEISIKFEEFSRMCRFCFKNNIILYSLFEENELRLQDCKNYTKSPFAHSAYFLNKSLGLEIFVEDGLPQSICQNCIEKLTICRDFLNQCHSATKLLHTVLAEHLNNDTVMKQEQEQEVCTEIVYLEPETHETPQHLLVSEKMKSENATVDEHSVADTSFKENCDDQKPEKRIRKKPEYQHCFICGLRCRYLNRHIQIMHSNDAKYECDICKTYAARSKGQLYIHMGAKHINKIKTEFVCSVCDRNFKNVKKLNNHMAAKHPARRHPCLHCHLVFKSERTLNRHQSIHTGERNFICEECGKAYRQTETLRNHQLRHFPPTVPCPHCDKMFYVKSQLRNHEGVHTGVRPWHCDICGASFVASSGLTVHRNKHKKENLFPTCKLCGEQFNDRLDLRMHMNDHRKSLI